MSDYLAKLKNSRNKPQVAYTEFVQSVRKRPNHLFCFFEGKDNDYYVPRIRQHTTDYHPIRCGGKEKVLKVHQLITGRPEYIKYKKAFFIDRDFDPPVASMVPAIFETPCYSIENFYVRTEVFQEILINAFGFSATSDQAFAVCVQLFIDRVAEFHAASLLFNAWYACLIDLRTQSIASGQKVDIGVQLDEKMPKGFINCSLSKITANYDLARIKATFPNALEVNPQALQNKINQFKQLDPFTTFRGKYQMEFLIRLIRLLLQDSRSTKAILKSKVNFAFGDASSIQNAQAITIFSAYAITPPSLNHYLEAVTK